MLQQEHAAQQYHTAQQRHGKIGLPGPHCPWFFVMDYHHIGGKGHDLKEQEGRIQVVREKHSHRRAAGQQREQIIAVSVAVMVQIIPGVDGGHHPHKGRDGTVERTEAVQAEMQSPFQKKSDTQIIFRAAKDCQQKPGQQQKFGDSHSAGEEIPRGFALSPDDIAEQRAAQGPEDGDQ